ncbi:DUF4241 domain-containing protein [Dactylosporangium sp. AC04546]|uniref:DUF4241 domain-containing protein n=1 Tax=Dactylosporangium sp. AC04546 TaxID=2862460 RepID=UPI002E7B86E6|nr:DUF4241 domain-containing protein [Dactylosporangium sp. AC04546]WVK88863.1 DUF4241 domain-containing protein [Dactylosporangium sp. AC04546]
MVIAVVPRFEAVYCDGWDGSVVNPLTATVAQARDAAGEPYTVVLLIDDRRHAVMDLSWADGYCCVSRFDAAGRQVSRHLLRGTPDGELFLRMAATWDGPPDAGEYEYPHVAARTSTTYRLSGERTDVIEPRGDLGARRETRSVQSPPQLPTPDFGRWQDLLGLAGDPPAEIVDAVRHPLPVRTATRPPWRPPRPLQPDGIDALFSPGAKVQCYDRELRLSVHTAGQLHLPSGRLIADDPSSLDLGAKPFSVTVPPGTYPVSVSLATFVDDPRHSRVAAARLDVGDRPAVRWELALREGQEPLDLGYREFFGFGVDAGMACFVDADSSERMKDVWRTLGGLVEPRYRTIGSGDMVAWSSGWGDGTYPTWIGYDTTGAVICFLADMLLFPTDEDDD